MKTKWEQVEREPSQPDIWREVCNSTGRLLCVEVAGTEPPPMRDGLCCFCGAVSCCTSGRCARHACATFVCVNDLREDGTEGEASK